MRTLASLVELWIATLFGLAGDVITTVLAGVAWVAC